MKIKRLSILSLVLAGLFFSSCNIKQEETSEEESKVLVELTTIETETIIKELEYTGVVQAWEDAYIGAASPARIEKIFVDVGDRVSKGQKLVQMDRTHLYQAKVQMDNLKNDLDRLEALLEEGAVTQQNYDQLKAQYEIAKSNYNNLAVNTEIKSTLDGVVTGRYYSDGEIFSMSPGPAGKPAIISVDQLNPVKVLIGVSENNFLNIKEGQDVKIVADIFGGKVFKGKVYKIHPKIDRATGTFPLEIKIDNPQYELLAGMFVRAKLNLGETTGVIVPSLAVLKQVGSNERYVFVVEDGIAVRKTVELGKKIDDNLEIISGVKAGEKLVIKGQHNLTHQDEVHVVN
ncbi:MAG: efflux RND transporter periplasmic adaptor subunit [Bacteroidota bacterium]